MGILGVLTSLWIMPAHAQMAMEQLGMLKFGTCYPSSYLAYTIIKKIDDHHYELRGDGETFEPHALLETKKAIFKSTGRPVGISMKRIGAKDMKLENGFSAPYLLWIECDYDDKVDCLPHLDPQLAWPSQKKKVDCTAKEAPAVDPKKSVKTKPADCQDPCFEKAQKNKFEKGETLESCLRDACR